MFLREHGRRKEDDKVGGVAKKLPPSALNIPREHEHPSHIAAPKVELHRPYEKKHDSTVLVNGCERGQYADYERRMLAEKRSHDQMSHDLSPPLLVNNKLYRDKPPTEGIQSRLHDADTSHPVGFAHSHKLGQYAYDRPHSEYSYSLGPQNAHHTTGQLTSLTNGQECVVRPLVSKLDLEAQERRRIRGNSDYNSDSSDSDDDYDARRDDRVQRLLVVAPLPVLPLDKSTKKLRYLEEFGLTTKENQKGEQQDLQPVVTHVSCGFI